MNCSEAVGPFAVYLPVFKKLTTLKKRHKIQLSAERKLREKNDSADVADTRQTSLKAEFLTCKVQKRTNSDSLTLMVGRHVPIHCEVSGRLRNFHHKSIYRPSHGDLAAEP